MIPPQPQTEEIKEEPKKEPVLAAKVQKNKDWDGFLEHLHGISPATGHNLEQGNITSEPRLSGGILSVNLGFPKSSKVFHEYISQVEVQKKLVKEEAQMLVLHTL